MRLLTAILASLLALGTLSAQEGSSRIEGTAIESGAGLPLAGVRVQATGPQSISATTTTDGRFVLEGLGAGRYQIATTSDRHAPVRGIWVTVKPGESLQDVALPLIPWAIVTGIVLDSRGQPVPNAMVFPTRRTFNATGDPILQITAGGQTSLSTNDRGEFRFFRLESGEIYFYVEPPVTGAPNATPPFWPVYFPGVTESAKAEATTVRAGDEVRLGAFTVIPAGDPVLRLRIVNLTGQALNAATRTVTVRSTPFRTTTFTILRRDESESAAIEIHGLSPGRHEILVAWTTSTGTAQGLIVAETGRVDTEAELRVAGSSRLSGQVGSAGARCTLRPFALMPPRVQLQGTSTLDGTFLIENVPAGDYRIECSDLPAHSYVRGVQLGTGNELVDRLRIEGDTTIKVIVGKAGGEVQGRVAGSNGQTVSGATVVLAPDATVAARNYLYKTATTDQNGTFLMPDVVPGAYRMFAWRELRGPAYLNEDFMRPYLQFAKPVQVDSDGHATENLTILD